MREVYLDHAATTPVRQEVLQAMLPYFSEQFGNPSSIHRFGRKIRKVVDEARDQCAKSLGVSPQEIYFTSGGTESDNIAILGTAAALADRGNHIITSAIEHHAALDTCKSLARRGFEVTVLPVDNQGMVSPESLAKAITEQTILVSIMHANNEVGTIQPLQELVHIAKQRGVLFHSDGVQTAGQIPLDLSQLGVDMYSLSAHKIYGPKGIGLLYMRKGSKVQGISYGGAQERKLRPGTENVPGIMGMAMALTLVIQEQAETCLRLIPLRDRLISGLTSLPDVSLNGHPRQRLPNNVNVSVDRVEGEALILSLDMAGIAVSSGSACTSGSLEPSHVLTAMGLSHRTAHGSLRLTLGRGTTDEDIDQTLSVVPEIIERLRRMSPLSRDQEKGGKRHV